MEARRPLGGVRPCRKLWRLGRARSGDIEAVCRAYIENLRAEKGPQAGYDAEQKLKMTVYGKEIGRIRRRELAPIHVQRWRNGLVTPQRTRQSANRIYRALVAALNWGHRCGTSKRIVRGRRSGSFPSVMVNEMVICPISNAQRSSRHVMGIKRPRILKKTGT
jgi:hypothetical protein